jgi:serine kinase of HPr protein (carbohydrate metabolism regulator)
MTVQDIIEPLALEPVAGKRGLDREVSGGYVSDLLSDVMGHAREGQVWITLQTHKNVVAIASLKEIPVVVLVRGRRPDDDAAAAAEEEGIVICSTPLETFEACGRLHRLFAPA